MSSRVYVTTTIPYVNARPHIGFALELVQADVLARYYRLTGHEVRFQTGTDDNATSNVLSAKARAIPVGRFVDKNAEAFRDLVTALDCSTDFFIRTRAPTHHRAVQRFLKSLDNDDTYVAAYRGRYCPRCEDFYLERDTTAGRCPEHEHPLDEVEEVNHFFRLSRYESIVRHLIATRRIEVIPETREAEVLRFLDRGLHDFSISRSAVRAAGWGVPFPGDADQVVYVWVDALINYLTGLGYPESEDCVFWWEGSRKIHVIGKNVWKFHAVYWPALLLSAGLPVPDKIFAHGFLTENGRKISKSAGIASDPRDFIATFGADAVRYFLLAHVRPYDDTDFSVGRLVDVYRTDLANILGNLASRLTALCERARLAGVDRSSPPVPDRYHEYFERCRFDLVAGALWRELDLLNAEIAAERPWESLKGAPPGDPGDSLRCWAERLYGVAYWLAPLLPSTASQIISTLTAREIRKAEPLFPKLAS
jgi:methionyl-tRNA synthetase